MTVFGTCISTTGDPPHKRIFTKDGRTPIPLGFMPVYHDYHGQTRWEEGLKLIPEGPRAQTKEYFYPELLEVVSIIYWYLSSEDVLSGAPQRKLTIPEIPALLFTMRDEPADNRKKGDFRFCSADKLSEEQRRFERAVILKDSLGGIRDNLDKINEVLCGGPRPNLLSMAFNAALGGPGNGPAIGGGRNGRPSGGGRGGTNPLRDAVRAALEWNGAPAQINPHLGLHRNL